jgi:hypothetical protein
LDKVQECPITIPSYPSICDLHVHRAEPLHDHAQVTANLAAVITDTANREHTQNQACDHREARQSDREILLAYAIILRLVSVPTTARKTFKVSLA